MQMCAGARPVPAQMWHGCAESWHRCGSGEETHLLVGLVFFVGAAAFLLQSATNGNDEHRDTLQHIVLQQIVLQQIVLQHVAILQQGRPSPPHSLRWREPKRANPDEVPHHGCRGASPVLVQMWKGRAQSRCRCGRGGPSPADNVAGVRRVPVQRWQGVTSPGADVAGASPVPAQMWKG